ncbi:hypothetical protein [Methylobacterium sp. ID0610]|uniref:hypothetical protein n=1 Tax=Methylobacterium carpenticola TaxID=3344827 RepID=UPI00368EF301
MLLAGAGALQAQPITSPQDKACRDEARARVFTTPDPQALGPYVIGRQIYMACMQRATAPAKRKVRRAKRGGRR